jgi:HD-GYP domain-containing protein (c-di-GMP phosphodiesterase class II)
MSTIKENLNQNERSHIESLTQIGIALSAERDINKFFNLILDEAINYTNADAGTIYTISDNQKCLDFKIVCTRSKKIKLGVADTARWPSVNLFDKDGKPKNQTFVAYVANSGKTAVIDDVYNQDIFDNSGTKDYDAKNNYQSKSMIAIPLKNHEDDILGVIQLINAMDENANITNFTDDHNFMLSSLASQAAIALSNKKLIHDLEDLLYQFIRSIAGAIDRKSRYTGGHITRVATLSEMISDKINNDTFHFKDLKFSEEELQEISISAWMHDIGKITTPIYVRDKSTKLETINDRIDLVRTRFKLVKSVIKYDILKNNDKNLDTLLDKLDKYWEFVLKANIGGEFMTDESLELLEEIGNFSYESEGEKYFLLTKDEKRNLAIRKGTLLPEEINIIREHAEITLQMLSELTFPKKLKHVPKYASSHHEKLNGGGYPLGLDSSQLPIQARLIAIADLYEALTASDRPYKKGKTLSESLRIMGFMAKDGDIDKDLLDLLLDSSLFLEYAKKYLKPEQIDNPDIDKIKSMYR